MRPKNEVNIGDVVRFRNGRSALMRLDGYHDHCGYRTWKGTHLFGEEISIVGNGMRKANKEELELWKSCQSDRYCHTANIGN